MRRWQTLRHKNVELNTRQTGSIMDRIALPQDSTGIVAAACFFAGRGTGKLFEPCKAMCAERSRNAKTRTCRGVKGRLARGKRRGSSNKTLRACTGSLSGTAQLGACMWHTKPPKCSAQVHDYRRSPSETSAEVSAAAAPV